MIVLYANKPPPALDVTAPADQFSAARAMVHLRQIAQKPHFIGTEENHRVRDYLTQALEALGGKVQLETTVGISGFGRRTYAGTAQNIVATFPGTSNSRAVMLVAHYDSVEYGPGAADDGAGVAGILETVRALKAGNSLANDLLVVFTDGEEQGPLGAAGFVADHPDLAERVGVAMNFEARGSSGPVLMFETSNENGWLIHEFARAAPYPMASSLMFTVYKHMPNDTDMTLIKGAGVKGLNFAFTGTLQDYHTRLDTPENLDQGTLQQLGSNALALSRRFGNLDLPSVRQPDRIYFNWLGSYIIEYRLWVAWALLFLTIAILTVVCRERLVTMKYLTSGIGGFFLLILVVLGGVHLAWWIIKLSAPHRLLVGDTSSNALFLLSLLGVGLGSGLAWQTQLISKLGGHNVAVGGILAVLALSGFLVIWLPGASYLLQWPLLISSLGLLLALRTRKPGIAAVYGLFGSLATILLFAPLTYLLFVNLDLNTISVSVIAILLGLFLTLTTPLLSQIINPLRRTLPLILICSIFAFLSGNWLSHFSAQHPHPDTIFYSLNADRKKAEWVSYDDAPDAWTSQFLGNHPDKGQEPAFLLGSDRKVLTKEAAAVGLEAPTAVVTKDEVANGTRVLNLHLASPRHANSVVMKLPAEVELLALAWNGRAHEVKSNPNSHSQWYLNYDVVPPGGLDLELRLASKGPFQCWLGDRSLGLPSIPGQTYAQRPEDCLPSYGSEVTLIGRQYTF